MSPDMSRFAASHGRHRYVELRHADIQTLRDWRNRQLDVLRQRAPLSEEEQERWYEEVVLPTHGSDRPRFLLVSILEDGERFIGYGGLTNVDWDHARAEVSFLLDPDRTEDPERYRGDLATFLAFLKEWAFRTLGLHRLHTETYDHRTHHIAALEEAGFTPEGTLRDHVRRPDGRWQSSRLHAVINHRPVDPTP